MGDSGQTTAVISRRVREGLEGPFRLWAQTVERELSRFPGHVGCQLVAPVGEAQPEWVFVFTFDSPKSLQAWISSEVRARWLATLEPMVEGPSTTHVVSGLETLFGLLPPDAAPPPPVWKVAVSVMMGLYPVSLLNTLYFQPLLRNLPVGLRVLVSAAIVVAAMTWAVMPLVTRLLKP